MEISTPYVGKHTSRTEASWYWNLTLNEEQQTRIALMWNKFLNIKRQQYDSLFLSNYRENNRKRIGFDLASKLLNTATDVYLKRNNIRDSNTLLENQEDTHENKK